MIHPVIFQICKFNMKKQPTEIRLQNSEVMSYHNIIQMSKNVKNLKE